MPKAELQNLKFKNIQSRWFAPIDGYYYMESIIEPVIGGGSNTKSSSTTIELDEHKSCSYALIFASLNEKKPVFFDLNCGPNVMIEFVKLLEQIAKSIYHVKQQYKNFSGERSITKREATLSWICENELNTSPQDQTVLDHCHFTRKLLRWAHSQCNLKRRNLSLLHCLLTI